jgi:hypothetical protein
MKVFFFVSLVSRVRALIRGGNVCEAYLHTPTKTKYSKLSLKGIESLLIPCNRELRNSRNMRAFMNNGGWEGM